MSATPKPARSWVPNCWLSARCAASRSNCHCGRRFGTSLLVSSASTASSGVSNSAGLTRSMKEANSLGAISATQKRPPARLSQAKPILSCAGSAAITYASRRSSSSALSVTVPGVIMRATWRSTGPLLVAGSPICSQITTDKPSLISFAKYCSTA